MFPDSTIAAKFQMKRTKLSYIISFGLAPYFKYELMSALQNASYFTVIFDECYNKETKSQQMDVLLRFWDDSNKQVCTKYLDSQFLSRGRAVDISKHLNIALQDLDQGKLIQISMDGPSTNLKFYRDYSDERDTKFPNSVKLINLGVCGLHVMNGAFKTGANSTDWHIDTLLRSLFYLFEDTYARRTDYIEITGSGEFIC